MDIYDVIDISLAHHGVKGMHWGVRRSRSELSSNVSTLQKGKKLKTKGGHNIPAHPDALSVAILKQGAKKSGVHALSNKQLQEAVTRMNLEQQFKRLQSKPKGDGQKFAEEQLKQVGRQSVAKAVAKKAARTAAVAAVLV